MSNFIKILPEELCVNFFDLLNNHWALITTPSPNGFNTMTASWGGTGILWNKPVAFIFIRPQRYTYELIENDDTFTLSFLSDKYKKELGYCGKVSGRDEDKIKECGFNVKTTENGSFIDEAEIAITCKKLYFGDILKSGFVDETLLSNYKDDDFHRMYIGEITGVYVKDK